MTDISPGILLPKRFTTLLGGDLIVSTGETEFQQEKRVLSPFKRGLTAAITLEGRMFCRIDDRPPITVEAPAVSLVLSAS